jgi:hypothetical protein
MSVCEIVYCKVFVHSDWFATGYFVPRFCCSGFYPVLLSCAWLPCSQSRTPYKIKMDDSHPSNLLQNWLWNLCFFALTHQTTFSFFSNMSESICLYFKKFTYLKINAQQRYKKRTSWTLSHIRCFGCLSYIKINGILLLHQSSCLYLWDFIILVVG